MTTGHADIAAMVADALAAMPDPLADTQVRQYEDDLARHFDVAFAIAVSCGTAALHCALSACEIGPGREVLVPALSVVMSAAPVIYAGARPVFVDCDPLVQASATTTLPQRPPLGAGPSSRSTSGAAQAIPHALTEFAAESPASGSSRTPARRTAAGSGGRLPAPSATWAASRPRTARSLVRRRRLHPHRRRRPGQPLPGLPHPLADTSGRSAAGYPDRLQLPASRAAGGHRPSQPHPLQRIAHPTATPEPPAFRATGEHAGISLPSQPGWNGYAPLAREPGPGQAAPVLRAAGQTRRAEQRRHLPPNALRSAAHVRIRDRHPMRERRSIHRITASRGRDRP